MSTKKQFHSKENNHASYHPQASSNNTQQHYSMTAFLKMHDKFYNLFPNPKELSTPEKFSRTIENLVSELSNDENSNSANHILQNLTKEVCVSLIKTSVKFKISLQVIKLLTKLSLITKNISVDFDDLILFFMKQISTDLAGYQDYFDTMNHLNEYFLKNFIKNSSENFKEENSENSSENDYIYDTIIKYIYYANFYEIYSLYPIFSLFLNNLCKNNLIFHFEKVLDFLVLYEIDISSCAINSYLENLCRNNLFGKCQKMIQRLTEYSPNYFFPNEIKKKYTSETVNKLNNEKYLLYWGINIISFGIFLKYLCKNEYLDIALYYYNELHSNNLLKDEIIYNLLLNGCSKKLDIKNLHKIYIEMLSKNIKPNLITYNTIIDAFIRNKNIQKAFSIFDDMIKNDIKPDNFTLSTLFKGITSQEHYKYLLQGIDIVKKNLYSVDIILVNVLLDACIKLKDQNNFVDLFENIINCNYKNITPDLITYNTFIKGCSKFKLYSKVDNAFNNLVKNSEKFNIFPNDVTFNSLIDVYVSQKDMNKVFSTVNLMQKFNIKPDNYTYTTIIKGLNKFSISNNENKNLISSISNNNELNLAFKLFNTVKQNGVPDEILYNCIMDACLRFNKIDKMLEIYQEMLQNNVKISSITCGIVIKAYGMQGNPEEAMKIYYKMKEEKIPISNVTYGCLINACIKNNNLDKAFELYENLKKEKYEMNTILYTTLIKAYSKKENLYKVCEIFSRMKESTNAKPNNITYNSVIDCCIKRNNFKAAYDFFKEMLRDINNTSENSIRPDIVTFSTLIKGEINNKCFGNARKLMQKLLEYNYIKLDCVLLNTLLDGCEKCNCYEEAIDIFNIFKSRGVECNMMTYSILMKICGKLNDFENSEKLLNEMEENKINFNLIIITCFIKTCFNTGHEIEGINIFKDIKNKYNLKPDNIAYTTIILGIIGNFEYNDYSDELVNFVISSVEDGIFLQQKIYMKCVYYLNYMGHFDKVQELNQFFFEKNMNNYGYYYNLHYMNYCQNMQNSQNMQNMQNTQKLNNEIKNTSKNSDNNMISSNNNGSNGSNSGSGSTGSNNEYNTVLEKIEEENKINCEDDSCENNSQITDFFGYAGNLVNFSNNAFCKNNEEQVNKNES